MSKGTKGKMLTGNGRQKPRIQSQERYQNCSVPREVKRDLGARQAKERNERDELQEIIQEIQINVTGMQEVQGRENQSKSSKIEQGVPPSSTIKNFVRGKPNKQGSHGRHAEKRLE